MVASHLICPCTSAELPELLGLLDEEFIFSKGRSVSLARRLPTALQPRNCPNILLACRGAAIAACIVIKRFDWITRERSWRGAMIGMVYTRPAERGRGLASLLLRRAESELRTDGVAFAVLWSARPDFYRRLGWISADCGVFGTVSAAGTSALGATRTACAASTASTVEALRISSAQAYMPRDDSSYLTLPPPAERLHMLASPQGTAYAIYGVRADSAYVYEFGGNPVSYAALWHDIGVAHASVCINERRGSASHHWFLRQPQISWRDQALALWRPLAEPACERFFDNWYIPFLDRI